MNRLLDSVGIRVVVVGLAREGTALARFLAERGVRVTVTDVKPAGAFADAVEALSGLAVTFALGGHPMELLDEADLVFVSPGVPLEIPFLAEARRRRLPLSSETRLFTRLCPAPIVGITGSSGKTTTTALVGEMLEAAGRQTWVGGNIGQPLIGHVDEITADDVVVMELSSFQLEFFGPWEGNWGTGNLVDWERALFDPGGWSPPIAAVLNITPNHLDRHPSMEAYIAAKAHVLNHQRPGDVVVLNLDNEVTRTLGEGRAPSRQQILWFSVEGEVREGAFLRGDELVLRLSEGEAVVCRRDQVRLLGQHNLANVLAACILAAAAGAPIQALRRVATTFAGVEHRLELVGERKGVRWYNDSIATTPERTVAALRAFDTPMVLLAGGRDKHLPWNEMATLTWQKVHDLILFGEAADLIEKQMQEASGGKEAGGATRIHRAGTLDRAVELAAHLARPGDVVLLSPGGTSFDAYRDFAARGRHFRKLVQELE
jgi:UDP-N-acetylmuramoylalanine--D-glutamate ligase